MSNLNLTGGIAVQSESNETASETLNVPKSSSNTHELVQAAGPGSHAFNFEGVLRQQIDEPGDSSFDAEDRMTKKQNNLRLRAKNVGWLDRLKLNRLNKRRAAPVKLSIEDMESADKDIAEFLNRAKHLEEVCKELAVEDKKREFAYRARDEEFKRLSNVVETLMNDNLMMKTKIEELEKKAKETATVDQDMLDEEEFPVVSSETLARTRGSKPKGVTNVWSNNNSKKLLQTLGSNLSNAQKAIQKEQISAVNALSTELNDRERRKPNVVVFNLKMSNKEKKEEKQAEDETQVKALIEKLNEGAKLKAEVVKVTRLQAKPDAIHPPAIIVELKDANTRNNLLLGAKKLKQVAGCEKVYLSADMTLAERIRYKELLKERIEKNAKRSEADKKKFRFAIRGDEVKKFKVIDDDEDL